jgi:hypothetical protein
MYWNSTKERRAASKRTLPTWLKDAVDKNKNRRSLQPIEIYQQRNKDEIQKRVKAESDMNGAKTKAERMTIRRKVVSDMWDEEDASVVAEIMEETLKRKGQAKRGMDEGEADERAPEEYHR